MTHHGGHETVMCTGSISVLEESWFSALQVNRICYLIHLVLPSSLLGLGFLTIEDSCSDTQFPTGLPVSLCACGQCSQAMLGLNWQNKGLPVSRHNCLGQKRHTLGVLWVATTLFFFFSVNNGFQSLYCHLLSHIKTALSWISLCIRLINNKSTKCPSRAFPPFKC